MEPKLDVKRVEKWLAENERSVAWMAGKLGILAATFYYRLSNGRLDDVAGIAGIMGIADPKDLIIMVEKEVKIENNSI